MSQPLDKMQPARRLHHVAQLPDLERKRRLLELALHDAPAEASQVAELVGAVAVGLALGEAAEALLARLDLGLVALEDGAGLVL